MSTSLTAWGGKVNVPFDDLDLCNALANVRELEAFESIVGGRRVEESAGQ